MNRYFPLNKIHGKIHDKIVVTGNPLRKLLFKLTDKEEACKHFELNSNKKCLLVLGGSLGARTINECILTHLELLIKAGIQIIWSTGASHFDNVKERIATIDKESYRYIKVYPFIKSIELAYAAADVIISRAGALTISELCIAGKPVIFVPSPNVAADHQTHNVLPLVKSNAALLVKDHQAPDRLVEEALSLLTDFDKQRTLADGIKRWARPQATDSIIDVIERYAFEAH
jgi:UDP-N-acetylglucosamine--N-acetylmuramyl-(pentapeptide) pyrophosphoryl-undecaprenol N-acetylglucosamine transferase